jgi:hypothetical protein
VTDRPVLLSRLAAAIARAPQDDPLTWRVCRAAKELLGVAGASITLENSTPNRLTLCATDDRSNELENLQDVLGEGPCRDAFDLDVTVGTALDRAAAERWPRFVPAAAEVIGQQGRLWSVPMRSGGQVIGAVSLYNLRKGVLAESPDDVQFLADAVAVTLVRDPLSTLSPGDPRDWGSRAQVHQATGMIIGQLGLNPDDALAIMRAYAFAQGTRLGDVARDIIARRVDLSGT